MNIQKLLVSIVLTLTGLGAYPQTEAAELSGDVTLLVASDLGRNGYYDQKQVAATMGRIAEQTGPEAVLAIGDNHHYGGLVCSLRQS